MTWGVSSLRVDFGSTRALDSIDLEIEPGRLIAVVGGDGSGKTTLCRVLARLIAPSAGRVRLPERDRVAYQSSSSGAWPDLSVAENLGFVARVHRLSASVAEQRTASLLEATGLEAAADRLGGHLSGGMRQKLGVAMALLPSPRLLVLDEPTTGVDPVSRAELWRVISHSAASGTAVVMATTYLDEAERADEILALESGTTLARGRHGDIAAAVPGRVWAMRAAPDTAARWRRGREWRAWTADDSAPAGGRRIEPDLTDLMVAATLARSAGQRS